MFSILYKGCRIGTHAVSYSSATGGRLVSTEIQIEARLAFFPAYAFSHRSEEAWRAGRLVSLNSKTVEQGQRLRVGAWRRVEAFAFSAFSAPAGALLLPPQH